MNQDSFFKLTFMLPLPSFNQGTHKLEINPCKALLISPTHTNTQLSADALSNG